MQSHKILLVLCTTLLGLITPCLAAAADEGAKIFEEVCTQCHTPKRQPLDNKHLTRQEWKDTIEQRMIGYGAEIPKGKMGDLLDYLVRTRGPVGTATDGAGKK